MHPLAGVDEADFERERAIVENELNQRNEMGVYGRVVAWMQAAMFPPGHPYARPIGGSTASLRRLTLADARSFVAEHYRPSNVALLVTGESAVTSAVASVASRLPAAVTSREATASRPPIKSLQAAASTGGAAAGEPARDGCRRARTCSRPRWRFPRSGWPTTWAAAATTPRSPRSSRRAPPRRSCANG